MKKSYNTILIIVLCSIILTGCNSSNKKEASKNKEPIKIEMDKEQKFIFSEREDISGLNPILDSNTNNETVHNMIYEGLVKNFVDETGRTRIMPGVAFRWETSTDGLKYTFYLREDARWHDGEVLGSDDFVYTLRQMADPKQKSKNSWLFEGIIENFSESSNGKGKNPEDIGVKAIDGETIEITLEKPYSSFLELVSKINPVRQDKYEEWGKEYGKSIDKTIMNGQFILEEWNIYQNMKFVKNKEYWNSENIILENIERKVIDTMDREINAFLNNEIDAIDGSNYDIEEFIKSKSKNVNLINYSSNSVEFILMNCNNKFLKNKTMRSAFSVGFDREEFIKKLREESDEPLYSIVPDSISINERTYTDRVDKQNRIVEKLREEYSDPMLLLEEGIWESKMGIESTDINLTLLIRKRDKNILKEAEWIKNQWEKNLKVHIDIEELSLTEILERIENNNFDMAWLGWEAEFNDPVAFMGLFDPKDGYFDKNSIGWNDESAEIYSEKLEESIYVSDPNEKSHTLLEAEKLLVGEGVVIPLFSPSSKYYIKDFVKGFNKNLDMLVDFKDIYIYGRN